MTFRFAPYIVGWALEHMTGIFDSREKAGQPCG